MSDTCTSECGLDRFPLGHPPTTEEDKQKMMRALYDSGCGYHAIADLAGRSHAEVADLLVRNWPAIKSLPHWPPVASH